MSKEKWSEVELENGKYTLIHNNGANFHALRYGNVWRSLTGDSLVLSMMNEIEDLRARLKSPVDYKSKFECLVEHAKRQDRVIADMRYDENVRRFYDDGAVWFWAGDESDNLESLACPVVINAGDLRALLAGVKMKTFEWKWKRFAWACHANWGWSSTIIDGSGRWVKVFGKLHYLAEKRDDYEARI